MAKKAKKPRRTTASGNLLEQTVKTVCRQKGFKILSYTEWSKTPNKHGNELLLTNVPYQSIYNQEGRTEFLLKSARYGLEIRIECKWQQVAGSVDEKLPYLYLNSIEAMPEQHIVVVIDGSGWKQGAIPWLKQAAANKKYTTATNATKKIEVLTLAEFMTWANATFK